MGYRCFTSDLSHSLYKALVIFVAVTKGTNMLFEQQITRKPNLYPWTKKFIKAMHTGFWTVEEFNFTADIQDFQTAMTPQEQEVIKRTLSAIAQIEVDVKTFWGRLGDNLPHPSMSDLGYALAGVEVIHNLAYERLLELLELDEIYEANMEEPVIKGRVTYLKKHLNREYNDDKKQYIYRLILFTLFIENVSLFSQFYVILWFGRFQNMLKDTNQQVMYTKNEEVIHAEVGIQLINTLREEYPGLFDDELEYRILSEAANAFQAESLVIDWMLGGYQAPKLNTDVLKQYVADRINSSLSRIGYKSKISTGYDPDKVEKCRNDAEWMDEEVYGNTQTDFFFKRPVDYAKKNTTSSGDELF